MSDPVPVADAFPSRAFRASEQAAVSDAAADPGTRGAARWVGWVSAGLGLLLSLVLHWRLRDMAFDDTYIHLRIARNLLRTGRAWFNPGERVMATSSPVWTLLMAGLHVPGHMGVLPVVEAVLLWVSGVLAFLVVRRSLARVPFGLVPATRVPAARVPTARAPAAAVQSVASAVLAAGAAAAVVVLLLPSSVGQMETPLAIALLLAAWVSALGEFSVSDEFSASDRSSALGESSAWRGRLSLPLLALAACTRLELLPVLFLAACVALGAGWKRALPGVAMASLTVAAAIAWTFWQFGVLLPNSVRAKQVTYGFTLREAVQQFYAFRLRDEAVLVLLACLLLAAGWTAFRRPADNFGGGAGGRRAGLLGWGAMVAALLMVANYVVHHTVIFDWYRPLVFVPLVLGLLICGGLAGGGLAPGRFWRGAVAMSSVAAVLFVTAEPLRRAGLILLAGLRPTAAAESRVDGGDSARVQGYLQMGEALRRLCPGTRLMTPEIGALGWAFAGEVQDSFGIASPEALRYQPLPPPYPRGGTPAGYVLAVLPDVLVGYRVLDWQPHDSAGVVARYDLLELPPSARSQRGGLLDGGWRSSKSLDVWMRKDGECPRAVLEGPLRREWE